MEICRHPDRSGAGRTGRTLGRPRALGCPQAAGDLCGCGCSGCALSTEGLNSLSRLQRPLQQTAFPIHKRGWFSDLRQGPRPSSLPSGSHACAPLTAASVSLFVLWASRHVVSAGMPDRCFRASSCFSYHIPHPGQTPQVVFNWLRRIRGAGALHLPSFVTARTSPHAPNPG